MKTLGESLDELGGPRYGDLLPWRDWECIALEGEADYQGGVEFIARDPTNHSRFIKYGYSYGSCSGCDGWESEFGYEEGADLKIIEEMERDAVFYDDASLNTLRLMLRRTTDEQEKDWRGKPTLLAQLESYMKLVNP